MKRRVGVCIVVGLLAIALSMLTFFSLRPAGQAAGSIPKPPSPSANAPRLTGTPPPWAPKTATAPGFTAIRPHLIGAIPAYTPADVRAYFAAQEPIQTAQGAARPTVTKVVCMTSAAAAAVTGQALQMPSVTHVCIATLRGLFQIDTPPALPPAFGDIATDVFDAQTGNLVAEFIHYTGTLTQTEQALQHATPTK